MARIARSCIRPIVAHQERWVRPPHDNATMIPALDSATPPTATQVAAAKASGIAVWSGYIATRPELGVGPVGSRFGLFRPWKQAEFVPVKALRSEERRVG